LRTFKRCHLVLTNRRNDVRGCNSTDHPGRVRLRDVSCCLSRARICDRHDAYNFSLKLHRPAVLRFRSTIKFIWLSIRLACIKADGPTTFSRPHWIVVKAGRTSCVRARAHILVTSHRLYCTYVLPVVSS
jgi:hypothetical protein